MSPDEPLTRENAADHAAAAALRGNTKSEAEAEADPSARTAREPSPLAQKWIAEPPGPVAIPPEVVAAREARREAQRAETQAHFAETEARRAERQAKFEADREARRAQMDAQREKQRARIEALREEQKQQSRRIQEPAEDVGNITQVREAAEFPPATGRCRPSVERKILARLRSAIKSHNKEHRDLPLHDIDRFLRDDLIEAAELVSPAAGHPLPDDFDQKNRIEQGRWVKRFSSVVLLREPRHDRDHADDAKRVRAFTHTFLNAPADEQRGAVLWSDDRITFETNWAPIDALLQTQERKTTAELIADPMPHFPAKHYE